MCGRFVSSSKPGELADYFAAEPAPDVELAANYNVAPTSEVYVVYDDGRVRRLDAFRWGLVPPWAKDLSVGARMINARAETVATTNAFRKAFAHRRCIVPADGFYEWTKVPGHKRKQPWYIHRPDGEPYAFAGLWERWRPGPAEPWMLSCTIITGAANEKMAELHDRMPIVLPPDRWSQWLDPATDTELVGALLVPTPSQLVTFHPVSTEVNKATNQGPQLVEPVAVIDPDGTGDRLV
ncbi:MAG: SOS response-associated peptidase [Acidimicrobiales bacterium]|nr:SOS response-associated peptidase [Acidimicrobiales bacterium]